MVEAKIDINTDDINEQSEDVTTKEMAEQQAAKRSRANEGDAVATNADGASPNVTDAANAPAEVMNSNPITVGYKKFASGSECYKYYHLVITKYRKNQNLNDVGFTTSFHSNPAQRGLSLTVDTRVFVYVADIFICLGLFCLFKFSTMLTQRNTPIFFSAVRVPQRNGTHPRWAP